MASAYLYDSDSDYQRAGMSQAALNVEAFDDGEEQAIEGFTAYLEAKGLLAEVVHDWGRQHHRQLREWARAAAAEDERLAGEERAERLGLI